MDAVGVAFDPKDGSIYFGRGTYELTPTATCIDKDGKAHYDVKDEYGTDSDAFRPISRTARLSRPASASPSAFTSTTTGDLFCTDQEGATWLPNGNPFDELLHIDLDKARHYGFPPRHPKHLPDVIDEPSTFDYGPQHQSTCGFCFNEPVKDGGPTFGPKLLGRRRVHDRRIARQALPHATCEDRDGLCREEPASSRA